MKEIKMPSYGSAGSLKNGNSGPTRGGSNAPKDSAMGKSTSGDATNVITKCGSNPKEYSPSSTSFSKNK